MASPWKLLARLISPGREQKRESGSTEKVTPEALANAGPTESPGEESLISAERGAAKIVEVTDPALSGGTGIAVTAAQTKTKRAVEVAPRKQRRRGKEAVAVANFSEVNDTAGEVNLDEEIRLLRDQLARKLKLQNAQLRKMLGRFER